MTDQIHRVVSKTLEDWSNGTGYLPTGRREAAWRVLSDYFPAQAAHRVSPSGRKEMAGATQPTCRTEPAALQRDPAGAAI